MEWFGSWLGEAPRGLYMQVNEAQIIQVCVCVPVRLVSHQPPIIVFFFCAAPTMCMNFSTVTPAA